MDMSTRKQKLQLECVLLCIGFCFAPEIIFGHEPTPSDKKPKVRKYDEGPLSSEDFQGQRPENVSTDEAKHDAFIRTQVQYEFRYGYETNGKTTTMKLQSIDTFAVVDQSNSWNLRKDDAELLDHEQGHFDLTHATALRIKLELQNGIKTKQPLESKGDSEKAAAKELDRKIMNIVDRISKDEIKVQLEYDRLTEHGRLAEPQAELRKQQKETIADLSDQLKRLKSE